MIGDQPLKPRRDEERGITAVIPGAGRSQRFGSFKLIAPIDREPLVARTIASVCDAGVRRIVLVLAPDSPAAELPLLRDPRITIVLNREPERGMFSSIQTGLAAAAGSDILLLPADMPFVRTETIAAVADAALARRCAVVPAYEGRRGHPLAIPAELVPGICAYDPAGTLKNALRSLGAELVSIPVDDRGVVRDVDVPADLL